LPGDAAAATDATWLSLAPALLGMPPLEPPDTLVRYSGVGYCLLGLVVERVTGRAFPVALAELVLGPLGITPSSDVVSTGSSVRIAGIDPVGAAVWRAANYPSAGLVGTAADALALARAFRPGVLLRPATCAFATRDQTGGLAGTGAFAWAHCAWGLGPGLQHELPPFWFAPPSAGPAAYGHGGAAGGIAWADPDADIAAAVLSTRAIGPWFSDVVATIGAAIHDGTRS